METYSGTVINTIVFTQKYVENAIMSLKPNSSPGIDEIPPVFLKECVETLKQPLADFLNNIMQSGKFPEMWKVALVTPIFKKGNKQHAENYRPISLTSVLCN